MEEELAQKNRKLKRLPILLTDELEEVMAAKTEMATSLSSKLISAAKTPEGVFIVTKRVLNRILDQNNTLQLKFVLFFKEKEDYLAKNSDLEESDDFSNDLLKEAGDFADEDYRGIIYIPDISKNSFFLMTQKETLDLKVSKIAQISYEFFLGSWNTMRKTPFISKKGIKSLLISPIFGIKEPKGGIVILSKKEFIEPFIDLPAVYEFCDLISDSFS